MTKRYSIVTNSLGLEPHLIAVSAAVLLMAFGDNLGKQFVPTYLEALGAPVLVIGLYGTARNFLDGVYPYPGGWIAKRIGRTPFVIATFLCFSLFPGAVMLASSFASLVVAFLMSGLREVGEPARKASSWTSQRHRYRRAGLASPNPCGALLSRLRQLWRSALAACTTRPVYCGWHHREDRSGYLCRDDRGALYGITVSQL